MQVCLMEASMELCYACAGGLIRGFVVNEIA